VTRGLVLAGLVALAGTGSVARARNLAVIPSELGSDAGSFEPDVSWGGPTLSFHSAPGLRPPAITVTADPDRASGDIFLTPTGNTAQQGPMILNARGQLVWFHPLTGNLAALNLQVQRYQGRPVLTWFRGTESGGEDVIMDRSYRTVAIVRAGDGYSADEHEFSITPRGTAWLDAYAPVHADLSSVGGPAHGAVFDDVIQEVDIRTGRVLWEWHSLGHIPISASHARYARFNLLGIYDYFHLNSIQQLPDGNLLISARNTWALYEISRRTGRVIWTLGGRHSSFGMGPGTRFEWQHDAHLGPHGILTLFDDAASPKEESQSSAKVLRIDEDAKRIRLVHRYTHTPPVLASVTGSVQILPNHNVFVGWGGARDFSEYAPGGRQLFDGSFATGVASYRAFRFLWHGSPRTRPALAVEARPGGGVTAYASWNGATGVGAWRVLGGGSANSLRPLARSPKTGFETAIHLAGSPRDLRVQALSSTGRVLGTSAVASGPRQ
jgi:hypothetical protein